MSEKEQETLQAIEKLLRGFYSKCIKNKKEYRTFVKGCKVDIVFGRVHRISVIKIDGMNDTLIKDNELLKFLEDNKCTIEGRMK